MALPKGLPRVLYLLLVEMQIVCSRNHSHCFGNICLGEGYDQGQPPEPLVNVTVVPMVMEVLQVSETQFSLTASYILAFMWHDKRIFFKETPQATTHVLDYNALKKIWTPKLKVRHVKHSSSDNGFGYYEKSLGIVTMDGKPWIELTNPTRAEISCPMYFKFYPFDTQTCNFIIEPLMFDVRLISWLVDSKQLDNQNIEMSYNISILPLLSKFRARKADPDTEAHIKQLFPDRTDFNTYTVGFTYVLARKYSKFIFIYYIPSCLCVVSSWGSFLISPKVVPGRVSLLVTLFLSLTGILVSTISSSPEVSQGLTALTFWVLVHFLFIFGAIVVYGVQLTLIRFAKDEYNQPEEEKDPEKRARIIDKRMILLFSSLYLIFNIFYWPVCLFGQGEIEDR